MPDMIFMVVDFPAPFGPNKPVILPSSKLKESPDNTCCGPYALEMFETTKDTIRES